MQRSSFITQNGNNFITLRKLVNVQLNHLHVWMYKSELVKHFLVHVLNSQVIAIQWILISLVLYQVSPFTGYTI